MKGQKMYNLTNMILAADAPRNVAFIAVLVIVGFIALILVLVLWKFFALWLRAKL